MSRHSGCYHNRGPDSPPVSASLPLWKRIAFVFLLSGVLGESAGKGLRRGSRLPGDQPQGAVPNLIADVMRVSAKLQLVTVESFLDAIGAIDEAQQRPVVVAG